jgi:hypothetical protein
VLKHSSSRHFRVEVADYYLTLHFSKTPSLRRVNVRTVRKSRNAHILEKLHQEKYLRPPSEIGPFCSAQTDLIDKR